MKYYKKIMSKKRLQVSTVKRSADVEEFYSDRSRIIFSSSFRRMQQKAQVFSLEPNSSVRTRLTHSIEVSDIGKTLASKIAYKLRNINQLTSYNIPSFVAIVENACLLHDIGNPPFGHFGEYAIKKWSSEKIGIIAEKKGLDTESDSFKLLMSDFYEFDGNPQGFRISTKLHCERDRYSLNLTYATLLASIKYARSTGEEVRNQSTQKKAGYFQTEKELVKKIKSDLDLEMYSRYPLTYIMEAADDIAYSLSDISDGIEKGILNVDKFKSEFKSEWKKEYPRNNNPIKNFDKIKSFNIDVSVKWTKLFLEEATNNYIKNHVKILEGTAKELLNDEGLGKVLKIIKNVSRRNLYNSSSAENIELTGYSVIYGLLTHYESILELDYDNFNKIINSEDIKGYDLQKRLINRLGKRYITNYKYEISTINIHDDFKLNELWLRIHLIIDHVSGMTDDFALDTYQMLEGIKLLTY